MQVGLPSQAQHVTYSGHVYRGPSPTDTGSSWAGPGEPADPPQWPLPADPILWGWLVADEGQLCPGRLGGGVGGLEDIL